MDKIITPKHAVERVLAQKTQPFSLIPYDNKLQKLLFFSAIGAIGIGLVNKFFGNNYAVISVKFFLLIAIVLVLLYQISMLFSSMKELRHSEKSISNPIVKEFDSDIDLISELSKDFLEHHLEYAKNSFAQTADQLRERIGLLVGAIEKVGVFPLGIAAYLSVQEAVNKKVVIFSEIEIMLFGLIVLYLFAIYLVTVSHKLDQIVLIYDQALSLKRSNKQLGTDEGVD